MQSTLRAIALVATLALGLAACGGSGGSESTPPPSGGNAPPAENPPPAALFTLALSGDKRVLLQGATGSVQATVTRAGGFNDAVTIELSGLPGVVDTSFAGGAVVTPVDTGEDFVNAVAVQADGKVLVAGSSAMIGGT